jgi:hypothetical protein
MRGYFPGHPLYQMFIDLLLGGWNPAKGLQRSSLYTSTVKMLVLTRLAGMMHAQKTKECTDLQLVATLKQVAPALLPQLQSVIGELVKDGPAAANGKIKLHLSAPFIPRIFGSKGRDRSFATRGAASGAFLPRWG